MSVNYLISFFSQEEKNQARDQDFGELARRNEHHHTSRGRQGSSLQNSGPHFRTRQQHRFQAALSGTLIPS